MVTEGRRGPDDSTAGSRRPIRELVLRHRAVVALLGGLAVAAVVFVLVWFQPQKYFLNTTVNEAAPRRIVANPVDPSTGTTPDAGQATVLASGEFRSLEHGTSGRAMVLELANGSRVLRFEALDTSNGPDLHVYLSELAAGDDARGYGEGFVDLGRLKGNKGNQNYAIPTEVDLSRYRSAVIWCKRFAVGFGVAPLDRSG
jgi:hypothetical protein